MRPNVRLGWHLSRNTITKCAARPRIQEDLKERTDSHLKRNADAYWRASASITPSTTSRLVGHPKIRAASEASTNSPPKKGAGACWKENASGMQPDQVAQNHARHRVSDKPAMSRHSSRGSNPGDAFEFGMDLFNAPPPPPLPPPPTLPTAAQPPPPIPISTHRAPAHHRARVHISFGDAAAAAAPIGSAMAAAAAAVGAAAPPAQTANYNERRNERRRVPVNIKDAKRQETLARRAAKKKAQREQKKLQKGGSRWFAR